MEEMKNKLILWYILMLLVQQAHVYEEVVGHYFLISYFGEPMYLVGNWLLFCLPLGLLYLVVRENKLAYYLSVVYAVLMMFQGIEHIVMAYVDGSLFVTYSGQVTGLASYIVGIPMVYYLYTNIERLNRQSVHMKRYIDTLRT